eukprot:TRINITY_DN27285_c0_g1_i1.p1 TRINITY_DN27285_c0_g1~~TRINITY_DN27285_c0_g1_i1.p1  ORF type:complete len:1118 (+),score=210.09 TRINITY_DN27285_c0_g1_i1:1478-4831(+)
MQWCFLALFVALHFRTAYAARPANEELDTQAESEFDASDEEFSDDADQEFDLINPGGSAFRETKSPLQRSAAQADRTSTSFVPASSPAAVDSPRPPSLPRNDKDMGSNKLVNISTSDAEVRDVEDKPARSQAAKSKAAASQDPHGIEFPTAHDAVAAVAAARNNSSTAPPMSSEEVNAKGQLSRGEEHNNQSTTPALVAPAANASEKMANRSQNSSSNQSVLATLLEALHKQDLSQLQGALSSLGHLLDNATISVNVNEPLATSTSLPEGANGNVSMANSCAYSPLGCAIQAGWEPGAAAFVKWCRGRNLTPQLDIDASGCATCGTNLHLAIQGNHSKLVHLLVEQNASVMRSNSAGLTALEAAAYAGVGQVVAELLTSSELRGGLFKLRLDILKAAEQLPNVLGWLLPSNTSWVDGLAFLQNMVPIAIKPGTSDLAIIGDMPSDWILLYQNKIMCARAHTRLSKKLSSDTLDLLLFEHGFNSFAWGLSLSCVFLAVVLSCFGLLVYITFRLRVYGSSEVPMSLGDLLTGAFDPCRLADSDFDPSKQRKQLPYRSVIGYVIPGNMSILNRIGVVVQAATGCYSSWMLLFVRIPPEQDVYDEEYLSDDDEQSRSRVRDVCVAKANRVRIFEVLLRTVSMGVLAFWLVWFARRWADAVLLLLLHVLHAYLASCVACCAVPATEPRIPGEENKEPDEELNAALCVMALFGVQQGPRWTRAMCTTRSTAAPSKAQKARQRRMRRPKEPPVAATGVTSDLNSSGNELFQSFTGGPPEKSIGRSERRAMASSSSNAAADLPEKDLPFSDLFQKHLLSSGVLHIQHGEFLQLAVGTIVSAILAIVWLLHLRWLIQGDFQQVYQRISAIELFQAYGAPGTSDRCLALTAEMMLIWFCCEWLHEVLCLIHVAKLSVRQRRSALAFLAEHNHILAVAGAEDAVSVHHAILHCEEVIRCSKFALELSDTRWLILRRPVQVVVFWSQMLFATSIVLSILPCVPFLHREKLQLLYEVLDPAVPMVLGLVLAPPLVTTLWAISVTNTEVRRQRQQLLNRVQVTLAASGLQSEEGDVEYVQLRVKSQEALARSSLTWNSGREIGLVDVFMTLFMAILCVGCAVLKGAEFIIP